MLAQGLNTQGGQLTQGLNAGLRAFLEFAELMLAAHVRTSLAMPVDVMRWTALGASVALDIELGALTRAAVEKAAQARLGVSLDASIDAALDTAARVTSGADLDAAKQTARDLRAAIKRGDDDG